MGASGALNPCSNPGGSAFFLKFYYEINILTKDIEKLGWEGSIEIKRTIKDKKLILEPM